MKGLGRSLAVLALPPPGGVRARWPRRGGISGRPSSSAGPTARSTASGTPARASGRPARAAARSAHRTACCPPPTSSRVSRRAACKSRSISRALSRITWANWSHGWLCCDVMCSLPCRSVMRRSTRLCIVSPGCRAIAAWLLCGAAFWLVPDGALIPLGAVWVVVAAGGVAAGPVWLPAVCAHAGAATSIVVISSGTARRASVTCMTGFSIVRTPMWAPVAADIRCQLWPHWPPRRELLWQEATEGRVPIGVPGWVRVSCPSRGLPQWRGLSVHPTGVRLMNWSPMSMKALVSHLPRKGEVEDAAI